MKQGEWLEFKTGQYPRTGETIVVKSIVGIYEYVVEVEKGPLTFHRLGDKSTKLSFHGLTHWQLIEMN